MILKRKIYAVHDRDLENFLSDLKILEGIKRGEIRCSECDCSITLQNLGFVSIKGKKIRVCCDDLDCLYKMRREVKGVGKK